MNARTIQNVSATVLDGLWIDYMTTASTNAHLRLYSGGSATIKTCIESDGKVGIGTINPTEILDVNGSINIVPGNDY